LTSAKYLNVTANSCKANAHLISFALLEADLVRYSNGLWSEWAEISVPKISKWFFRKATSAVAYKLHVQRSTTYSESHLISCLKKQLPSQRGDVGQYDVFYIGISSYVSLSRRPDVLPCTTCCRLQLPLRCSVITPEHFRLVLRFGLSSMFLSKVNFG